MKITLNLFVLLFLSSLLLIISCGKDDDIEEPNVPVNCGDYICENGGICLDNICQCPTGYSGNSCETRLNPSSVTLTSIVVKDFPVADAFGTAWDTDGKADLTFAIYQGADLLYSHSAVITDANPIDDHSFSVSSFSFDNPNANYIILLLDDDGSNAPQEISSYSFKPALSEGTIGVLELRGGSSQIDAGLGYVY